MPIITAREAALKALIAWRRDGEWSESALNGIIGRNVLDRRESALAVGICYGVIQNKLLCDYYISCYCSIKLRKLEPAVLDILRLSAYQLLFLDKIPSSAAVNEGVVLAQKYANPRAAGLVNAVLRRLSENAEHLPQISSGSKAEYLSIKYSHPLWLVNEYADAPGEKGCEALLIADNAVPTVTAQVNTLKANTGDVIRELDAEGIAASPHPWLDNTLELSQPGKLEIIPAFKEGRIYIQDAAARLSVIAADPKPGMTVIDACAAPGGKSFTAGLMMHNSGRILSYDSKQRKIGGITSAAAKLGIRIIDAKCADATQWIPELQEMADVVIADVPCSGLGVIRKKPEIRYKDEESLRELPELQYSILKNVSGYVRPGGVLLYSTCTLLSRENEDVVQRFLAENSGFVPEGFELPGPAGIAESGMITLWPHIHGTDGFFICKMRKL